MLTLFENKFGLVLPLDYLICATRLEQETNDIFDTKSSEQNKNMKSQTSGKIEIKKGLSDASNLEHVVF